MKKKSVKSLKLKKTNVSHLTGGICKCLIHSTMVGVAENNEGAEGWLSDFFSCNSCGCNPKSEVSNK